MEGKQRDYQIGPYGKAPEQWTLKEAREEGARLDVLRRQGEDPRALKSEQRQTIQRTGAVTFQKAADECFVCTSSKLAAPTLKDYKNNLENQILPVRILMGAASPASDHHHPPGGGAFLLIQHDAEQPDRHLPDFTCSDSASSGRFGLAIQC
jgi:hypothetical protein